MAGCVRSRQGRRLIARADLVLPGGLAKDLKLTEVPLVRQLWAGRLSLTSPATKLKSLLAADSVRGRDPEPVIDKRKEETMPLAHPGTTPAVPPYFNNLRFRPNG